MRVSVRNLSINMNIPIPMPILITCVVVHCSKQQVSNTVNTTRIREDQVRGETPETKQLYNAEKLFGKTQQLDLCRTAETGID